MDTMCYVHYWFDLLDFGRWAKSDGMVINVIMDLCLASIENGRYGKTLLKYEKTEHEKYENKVEKEALQRDPKKNNQRVGFVVSDGCVVSIAGEGRGMVKELKKRCSCWRTRVDTGSLHAPFPTGGLT